MTNKLNPGKRTEAAMAKWLKLPIMQRTALLTFASSKGETVILFGSLGEEIGRFTLASLIKKRYPRRKKSGR